METVFQMLRDPDDDNDGIPDEEEIKMEQIQK